MDMILADTNVLLRSVEPLHGMHVAAVNALIASTEKYGSVCVLPQNLIEFWNVATRPADRNGLGWTPIVTEDEVSRFESIFEVLPDSQAIYAEWRTLVRDNSVLGKQVHDARIVAAMNVHGISKLLTFNVSDFKRYQHVTLIDPESLVDSDAAA